MRRALEQEITPGIVVADAGYGVDTRFRKGLSELDLEYVVGVQSSATVWEPGKEPLPAKPYQGTGRPPRLLRRDKNHQPLAAKQVAMSLPAEAWTIVNWRQGTGKNSAPGSRRCASDQRIGIIGKLLRMRKNGCWWSGQRQKKNPQNIGSLIYPQILGCRRLWPLPNNAGLSNGITRN